MRGPPTAAGRSAATSGRRTTDCGLRMRRLPVRHSLEMRRLTVHRSLRMPLNGSVRRLSVHRRLRVPLDRSVR